ncbi:MAG: asparaginase [Bacteroidota bacterium]|nr:asparaginase [Bacteroidota bacterium]
MSNPILVEVFRGEVLESFHRGVICIVDSDNKILYSQGDVQQVCFPRSALKFFQQIPLLTSGAAEHFGFTKKEIAIMCGSHNGELFHVENVRSILNKIGKTEDDLMCGPQMPTLKEDQYYLIKNNLKPLKIHNNCSGKHAGFLAYCVYNQLDTKDYINPNHPLHQTILNVISDFHHYPLSSIKQGVDGCSAPIFAFPVYNQAIAYKNLVNPSQFDDATKKACILMIQSILEYPEMIAGTNRYCSDLMKFSNGQVLGKTGADGVYSLGLIKKQMGVCIKIDDGKMGPQYNVAQHIVEKLNILSEDDNESLKHYIQFENKNFGGMLTGITKISDFLDFSNI